MELHPQAIEFLQQVEARGLPDWSELGLAQARDLFAQMEPLFGTPEPVAEVIDVAPLDSPPMRLYHPQPDRPLPVTLYLHGGGWVMGDRGTHDSLCRRLANESQTAVFSVDYRRAPEHPFPIPLQDCRAALKYVMGQEAGPTIDGTRVAIAGDSAGGNLAAALALECGRQRIALRGLLLVYPALNTDFETGSYRQFSQGFGLTRDAMMWFWKQYLDGVETTQDAQAAPFLADRLDSLPRTHIVTAAYDVLRDEGEAFAELLRGAGVDVTCRRYAGMLHGFVHFAGAFDTGLEARDEIAAFLREVLGPSNL